MKIKTKIELKNVELPYGEYKIKFDIKFNTNSFTVLLGKSGAGKSSLLNVIGGFVLPKKGDLLIDEENMNEVLPADRGVTILFQSNNLFQHLSVFDNIALGIKTDLNLEKQDQNFLFSVMNDLEISDLSTKKPSEISEGEQQRVGLARCLVQKKPILLLDEPFSNLDPPLRKKLYKLVFNHTRKNNITTIMASHFPLEVKDYADEIIFLEKGEVLLQKSSKYFFSSKNDKFLTFLC